MLKTLGTDWKRQLCFLLLAVLSFCLLCAPGAFAADSADTGKCGSCAWNVTDGTLTLYPASGASCDLDAACCDGSTAASRPAWAGREDIFSVVLNGTINAGPYAGSLFYGLPNLSSVFGMKNLIVSQDAAENVPTAEPTAVPTSIPALQIVRNNNLPAEILNAQVDDHIFFGHYEQDNNLYTGAEPIEWRVLARRNGQLFLVSEYALAQKEYNELFESTTWENCTLRTWLNDDFYNRAFTAEEQQQIAETQVYAEENPQYETEAGNDTKDKIFLLSIDEVRTYFKKTAKARRCRVSLSAGFKGEFSYGEYGGVKWWWLRSPGIKNKLRGYNLYYSRGVFYDDMSVYAAYVSESGGIAFDGVFVNDVGYVRPALWLNLE